MSAALTVARKELRALFHSPIALIFLGVFGGATLLIFFTIERFFARNLADVRPLFEWLPLLLIFLVSAVTMRAWAEERRSGTLEILLTLPVRTADLVLGKFLAGLALVGVALALTLPLPILVSTLGVLDWGPVIGGYVGALALGCAYLAIGLAVSSRTDNQVVALMVTVVCGGLLYLVGADGVVALFGDDVAGVLRSVGSGSRFTSIERGVLDLRDLVYYGSLTALFLVVGGASLEATRLDPRANRRQIGGLRLLVGLSALNAVALNVWLAPVSGARLDLTENGDYSISAVTEEALSSLDGPLYISGYFSERSHPLLAPLVPQIKDLLAEYVLAGEGRVELSLHDPATDAELEQEIGEQYGIRSFPFGVTDRNAQSVVNAYFHVLVRFGDEYEVLSFQDLIDVSASDDGLDVRLRNLEYDLTRTIRRVSQDFQSAGALLAQVPEGARMTLYATPGQIPEEFAETAEAMRSVAEQVAARSEGRLRFTEIDPAGDDALAQELYERLGLRPLAADLLGTQVFYLHLVLEIGEQVERILPRGALTSADVEQAIEASVRRATPGQLKSVGLVTETPEAPPPNPQLPPQLQPPAPQPDYRAIEQILSEGYQIRRVELTEGHVPDDVDVLVVGKAGALSPAQQLAIDQYLMGGGSVVALAGAWRVGVDRGGLSPTREERTLADMLETWGAVVGDALVMDPLNAPFPIPVTERRGMFSMQRIELLPYPMFPDVRDDGFLRGHAALAGLGAVTVPWSSPLTVPETLEGRQVEILLRSSEGTWLNTSGTIEPDFTAWPDDGFGSSSPAGSQVLAAAITGRFPSVFADRPSPLFSGEAGAVRHMEASVADGRLLVVGSSEIVSDMVVQLSGQSGGEPHAGNLQLLQNAIDWASEDTALLSIRGGGAFARTLRPLDDEARAAREWTTAAAVFIPLLLIGIVPRARRSRPESIAAGTSAAGSIEAVEGSA